MRYKIWKKIFLQCTFFTFLSCFTAHSQHTHYVKAIWEWKHDAERFLWGRKKSFLIVRRQRERASFETCLLLLFAQLSLGFCFFPWLLKRRVYIEIICRINRFLCRNSFYFAKNSMSERACTNSLEYSLYLIESKINIFSRSGFILASYEASDCHYAYTIHSLMRELYRFFILISFPASNLFIFSHQGHSFSFSHDFYVLQYFLSSFCMKIKLIFFALSLYYLLVELFYNFLSVQTHTISLFSLSLSLSFFPFLAHHHNTPACLI